MSKRAIGDVRPSQVITTFGPGAIVDLQTLSVIVGGIVIAMFLPLIKLIEGIT